MMLRVDNSCCEPMCLYHCTIILFVVHFVACDFAVCNWSINSLVDVHLSSAVEILLVFM